MKRSRHEPSDRSFSEEPAPNGQLLLAALDRIMMSALRASTTTQMPRRPNGGAPQQNCNRVRPAARNDKELVGSVRVTVLETQRPTSQWLESSAWRPAPTSGRDASLQLSRIIDRTARDTVKWSRHEPTDRSLNERPVPNGQLLLAARQRIMVDALRASRTLSAAAPQRRGAAAEQQCR